MNLGRETECVLAAMGEAAALLHRFEARRTTLAREAKAGDELVTQADRALNDLLVARIHTAMPGDAICAEEGCDFDQPLAARRWFIDPLDGTRSFMAGRAGYSILVGLVVEGTPRLGVIYDAAARATFIARKGEGVIDVGASRRLRGARSSRLVWSPFSRPEAAYTVARSLGMHDVGLCESVGLRALEMARGRAAVFGSGPRSPKLWDSAAAWAVVHELGGSYTDFEGAPLRYDGAGVIHERGAVASLGMDHGLVVTAMREALEGVRV